MTYQYKGFTYPSKEYALAAEKVRSAGMFETTENVKAAMEGKPFAGVSTKDRQWIKSAPDAPDYSQVRTIKDANEVINAGQDKDIIDEEKKGAPPVKPYAGLLDIFKDITTAIKPKTAAPELPQFEQKFTDLRTKYGVEGLESQLSELKAQEDALYAQQRTRTAAERGKPVAMNVISGRVGEVERQEAERIDAIQRQIRNVSDQLNTKYKMIDTYMKLADMDYDNASAAYDRDFSNNLSIFNVVRGIDESQKTDEERLIDNARANAQIVINAMTTKNLTYDQLSEDEQLNLTKLSVQAGLGADFFATVMNVSTGKEILTTIVSDDKTRATIMYKDGTTKTVETGLPPSPTDEDEFGAATKTQQAQAMNWLMQQPNVSQDDIDRLKTDRAFFAWVLAKSEEL